MDRPWNPNLQAELVRRPGLSPIELGNTTSGPTCPDIWELSNGDFAVIGREATSAYDHRLPEGVKISNDERLVVIPRSTLLSAAVGL